MWSGFSSDSPRGCRNRVLPNVSGNCDLPPGLLMRPALAIALLLFANSASAQDLWKLVAQSHHIVVGIPAPPMDQIEDAQRTGRHRYVDVPVHIRECIKGDACKGTKTIRYYTRPDSYGPGPGKLSRLGNKLSVFFLMQVDEVSTRGMYFAGYTPGALQPYTDALARQVRAEAQAQRKILDRFAQNFRPQDEPSHEQVKALVGAMLHRDTEEKAFADLEAMGEAAVAAMILLMDDRRELPIRHISLVNKSPGAFEGIRHYGPEVVADAIDAILGQISGERFGHIHNGGSERERVEAINGWRIYLHHVRSGARLRH
jgi:hypothetical protein